LFVLSLLGLAGLVLLNSFFAFLLLAEILFYILVCLLAGIRARLKFGKPYLSVGLTLAIPVMHISWGSGFLWSLLTSGFRKNG
jgi:hypothetical protein